MATTTNGGRWRFWLAAAAVFLLCSLAPERHPAAIRGRHGRRVFSTPSSHVPAARLGLSRTMATTAVTIAVVLLTIGITMAILPPLFASCKGWIAKTPEYVVKAAMCIQPLIEPLLEVRCGRSASATC